LASAADGGYEDFVSQMNQLAASIGLDSSAFQNPAGFDHPDHYSSARDLAVLFRASLRDPFIAELLASSMITTGASEATAAGRMVPLTFDTTHALLGSDPRVLAGKTGTTDEAKQVLITLLQVNQHPYIIVLLGSSDRYQETLRLADWVEQRYTWQIVEPQQLLPAITQKE
jgi:D-alanyl-D-alanine carboxypeptidase